MPAFCAVVGCSKRAERDVVRFFRIPKAYKNRGERLDAISKERRLSWIRALRRGNLSDTFINNARICANHFVSGEPAKLQDTENPDWVPSVSMGYSTSETQDKATVKRNGRSVKRLKMDEVYEVKDSVLNKAYTAGPTTNFIESERLTPRKFKPWLEVIGRDPTEGLSIHNSTCWDHFLADSLERVNKKVLSKSVVPSINLKPTFNRSLNFSKPEPFVGKKRLKINSTSNNKDLKGCKKERKKALNTVCNHVLSLRKLDKRAKQLKKENLKLRQTVKTAMAHTKRLTDKIKKLKYVLKDMKDKKIICDYTLTVLEQAVL